MMIKLKLPYPPSINNYYIRSKNGVFINAPGRAYRRLIERTLWGCITEGNKMDSVPLNGDLMVEIIIYPPDKRKRDIDNIKKALFDALQHAGLYHDDNQICDDHTVRINKMIKGGLIDFRIGKAIERPSMNDEVFLNGAWI